MTKTELMGRKMSLLPCRLAFLVLYRVPHPPISPAIHHRIPAGKKTDDNGLKLFIPVAVNAICKIEYILQDQPSLWSCPTDPLSIARTVDRSLQCRAPCGTVSQCLSTPQTLYWPTRAAPVSDRSAINAGN